MNKKKKEEPIWMQLYREKVIKPKQKQRQTETRGRTAASRAGCYNSKAWKILRTQRIRNNAICQECEKIGKINAAKIVDHIKPVEDYPELFLCYDNTQSLCLFHHDLKTKQDTKERNKKIKLNNGRQLMKELEKKHDTPGG